MLEIINIFIAPEILLSLIILILILYVVKFPIIKLSIVLLLIVGWTSLLYWIFFDRWVYDYIFNGLLVVNSWVIILKLIVILCSLSILLMGIYEPDLKQSYDSFSLLMLLLVLGGILIISSVNWISVYLAIELQTLVLFIQVTLKKDSPYGSEAGLKYFILSALSSSLFLFGCALLYGLTGEVSVQGVNSILTVDVGKILITISLLFKFTAAPFHMWAPDVYQGAPTIVTALLATVPKISIFSILLQIGPVINIVLLSSIISIIWGAIGALNQANIKRLIAYSGINHMGFILLAIGINTFESMQAGLIYIIIYLITTICTFSIILSLGLKKNIIVEVSGLGRYNPVKGITLALIFLSIAGVPPLAGFLGKLLILLPAISNNYFLISIVVVVSSVIAGVYYVRLVHLIYFPVDYSLLVWQKILNKPQNETFGRSVLMGVCLFVLLFLLISPNFLLQLTHNATISLY